MRWTMPTGLFQMPMASMLLASASSVTSLALGTGTTMHLEEVLVGIVLREVQGAASSVSRRVTLPGNALTLMEMTTETTVEEEVGTTTTTMGAATTTMGATVTVEGTTTTTEAMTEGTTTATETTTTTGTDRSLAPIHPPPSEIPRNAVSPDPTLDLPSATRTSSSAGPVQPGVTVASERTVGAGVGVWRRSGPLFVADHPATPAAALD